MSGGPGPEHRRIASEAERAAGRPVTAEQVERWAEAGLLPAPVIRGRGRGRGVTARYPPAATSTAALLACALAERRRLSEATLVAFARGAEIRERGLRWAYRQEHERLWQGLADLFGIQADERPTEDVALWAGGELLRRAGERPSRFPTTRAIRTRLGGSAAAVLGSVLALVAGAATSIHGEALAALGPALRSDFGWLGAALSEPDPATRRGLAGLALPRLRSITEGADACDLARARDVLLVVSEVARRVARRGGIVGRVARIAHAALSDDYNRALIAVPVLLWVVRLGEFEDQWAELRSLPEDAWSQVRAEPGKAARRLIEETLGRSRQSPPN